MSKNTWSKKELEKFKKEINTKRWNLSEDLRELKAKADDILEWVLFGEAELGSMRVPEELRKELAIEGNKYGEANYGKGFEYIFNEIPILITFESDWKKTKKILQEIAKNIGDKSSKAAEKQIKQASKKFLIEEQKVEPEVYTKVADSGVLLTIRYLCKPSYRRDTEHENW